MKSWSLWGSLMILLFTVGCGTEPAWHYVVPGPVIWGEIQITADQLAEEWDWSEVDAIIATAKQSDERLVLPVWPYALWDQASCHGDWPSQLSVLDPQLQAPYTPCDVTAYQAWLTALVQRYQGEVYAWQVIATPDQQTEPLAHFMGGAKTYSTLAVTTADTIHVAHADSRVILGDVSTTKPDSITFFVSVWSDPAVQAAVDAVSVQADVAADWSVVESLQQRSQLAKPIWILNNDEDNNSNGSTITIR